jgi:hypothetical protein
VTPVPLELPLRPADAAELANLIFDHAEGKPLSDDVRNRLAARAAAIKFQTLSPFFGSLERDPVHHSVYYLAVDAGPGAGDGPAVPLLLHIARAAAPTSSLYPKPLLIGRMRRPNGSEMVINAIPFSPCERRNVETFAARINSAFYPQPQGARTTITVEQDYPAAFETFRAIQKRTGKNLAALYGDYYAAMWAAIRAGWRSAYTIAGLPGSETFSRYTIAIDAAVEGLNEAERVYQQIRQARAALKISRGFDIELEAATSLTPEFLRTALEHLKQHGHVPQLICPGPVAEEDLDRMAAVAQFFQVTLTFRYLGEPAETVRAIAKATAGRLNYHVRNAAEAEFAAEHLL